MATDPVKRVREFENESVFAGDLRAELSTLAAVEPVAGVPYLTVVIDWSIEGSEPGRIAPPPLKRSQEREVQQTSAPRRPGWQQIKRELDALVADQGPRGDDLESITADVARITEYIEGQLDLNAQSVYIVACNRRGVFEAVPLDVPNPSSLVVEYIPGLRPLIHAAEDFPTYAVVNADQQNAVVWLMDRNTWSTGVEVESDGYPRHQSSGGLNQQRYQARAGERVDAFARVIAAELTRMFVDAKNPPDYLIISADEPIYSALTAQLHPEVTKKILGRHTLESAAAPRDVAAGVAPMVVAEERRLEGEAVQAVKDAVGAQNRGIAGPVDTLRALAAGQVQLLVMNDDFSAPGWADYTFPVFGVGEPPAEHPIGGDVANIVRTRLEDDAARLAILNGGDVELVQSAVALEDTGVPRATGELPRSEAAAALDELGGIGALLRYDIS